MKFDVLRRQRKSKGMTLVEVLVVVTVFVIVLVSFARTFAASGAMIAESKARLTALSLAGQQMERLRNLPYDRVAVSGGIPAGNIDPDVSVNIGSKAFRVRTDIRYVDDPEDGTIDGVIVDPVPNDYKRVQVDVAWGGESEAERVTLVSRFVPPGIETSAGGGTLALTVLDARGEAVSDAAVTIVNNTVSPSINIGVFTDSAGRVLVPGAPSANNYAITVAKGGYETVQTHPPYPQSPFDPVDEHVSVIQGALTARTIIAGRLSELTLDLRDPFDRKSSVGALDIVGGRLLGSKPDGSSVYNFEQTVGADANAQIKLNDVSPGTYTVSYSGNDYKLLYVDDSSTAETNTVSLSQGSEQVHKVVLADVNEPAFFIRVTDGADGTAISGAEVRVQNSSLAYDEQVTTSAYGQAFFPLNLDKPLLDNTAYTITVSAAGYDQSVQAVTVNGLTEVSIALFAQ